MYIGGNNGIVVATDTCKNTVYCVAANNAFESIEDFGILLGKHFLKEYPQIVKSINIEILQDIWERLPGVDSSGRPAPHNHSFKRVGPQKNWTHVTLTQQQPLGRPSVAAAVTVRSGVRSVEILKTAQSGFSNFHRDRYTSLAETDDRLLGTSLTAEWLYADGTSTAAAQFDFSAAREKVSVSHTIPYHTIPSPLIGTSYIHSCMHTYIHTGSDGAVACLHGTQRPGRVQSLRAADAVSDGAC